MTSSTTADSFRFDLKIIFKQFWYIGTVVLPLILDTQSEP